MLEQIHAHCCPSCCSAESQTPAQLEVSRRSFLAAGGVLMGGLSYAAFQGALQAADDAAPVDMPAPRKPLIVKPVLVWDNPQRREKTSWRGWGEVHTPEEAAEEVARIKGELNALKQRADYPVEFMEVTTANVVDQLKDNPDMAQCDVILYYGAGGSINGVQNFGKDVIIFQRWKSGPVYLQYEIVSPRFLRQHTDFEKVPGITHNDVVTDKLEEVEWRLRALCGLKNTLNSKIVTIGGASSWAQPAGVVPDKVKQRWNFEYHDVDYDKMGKLIADARKDEKAMARATKRAEAHLKIPGTKLEVPMEWFVSSFLLDDIFRLLMKEVGTNLITVNSCMGAIMRSDTTACYTLTTLNDDGYLAWCESDFVVIPSGVLLGNICGKPVFFCNPTYPSNGVITISHCTAPRKMDGKSYDPVRIVTHYESDYGAAPWIQAPIGTELTCILSSFTTDRRVGFKGAVVDVPFRKICRTQFDVRYSFPDDLLANNLIGFHWAVAYGDYRREVGYALRRVGVQWDNLDEVPTKAMS